MAQTQQFPDDLRLPNYFQNPKIIGITEWLPDQPALNNSGLTIARNVIPLSLTSYGPLPALAASNVSRIPEPVFGVFSFFDQSRQEHVFVGTGPNLYHLSTAAADFSNISNPGERYNGSISSPWSMTAYHQSIIATNGIDPPQVFTIGTDSTFGYLTSDFSAPIGRYVATVRDFVMFGNCTEGGHVFPSRVHWSAIGNPSYYPDSNSTDPTIAEQAAEVQSDFQDLRSDLGWIRGLASGLQSADVAIFMDEAVYSGFYVGSPAVFSFQVAQGAVGCRIPNSIVTNRGFAYYLGQNGFVAFDGVTPTMIGAQKIDRWFFTDPNDGVDPNYISATQGAADPTGELIFWLYCGPNSGGVPNRVICYNWQLQRWSMGMINAQWVAKSVTTGYSLDELDEFGTMTTLAHSLDSPVWQGGAPALVLFDFDNQMSTFSGPNLPATIATLEAQPSPGRRSRVTSARPLIDGLDGLVGASDPYGSGPYGRGSYGYAPASTTITMGSRNRLGDAVTYASAIPMNIWGECPQRSDARYLRGQINIPAATIWTHCMGMEVNFAKSTVR